jgi:DNA-binding MarR family transcriptional regulator
MTDDATAAPPPVPAAAADGDRPETVASVADSFRALQRTVRRSKARLLAAAGDDVESATQVLLHAVAAEGPMRASALAASVHADLSTVSRQVAVLVGRGLLERQADQCDGRASLLAVTGAGRAAVAEHEQGRQVFFDTVLAGWETEEMHQFARQMERFTAAYDSVHTAWVTEQTRRADAHPRAPERASAQDHPADPEEGTTA